MGYFVESLSQLVGRKPSRPSKEQLSPAVAKIYHQKRMHRMTRAELEAIREAHLKKRGNHKWRNRRWITLIVINLLFVVSYYFDVQLIEGALTALG